MVIVISADARSNVTRFRYKNVFFQDSCTTATRIVGTCAKKRGLSALLLHVPARDLRVTQESEVLCRRLSAACACRQVWHLVEILGREIGRVELILEIGYERCVNVADRGPVDSVEEGMTLDLVNVQSILGAGKQPKVRPLENIMVYRQLRNVPSNQIFGFPTKPDIIREMQVVLPLDDLLVCLVRILGTKGRVSCRGEMMSAAMRKGQRNDTYRRGTRT